MIVFACMMDLVIMSIMLFSGALVCVLEYFRVRLVCHLVLVVLWMFWLF